MRKNLRAAKLFSWRPLAPLVALIVAVGCASVETTEPGTVGVERRQTMSVLVSEEDINKGAAQAYAQVLDEARRKGVLNRNATQVARVRAVAQRIILEQVAKGGPPAWLSTHPSSEARIRDLHVYAEKVMPLYQARR